MIHQRWINEEVWDRDPQGFFFFFFAVVVSLIIARLQIILPVQLMVPGCQQWQFNYSLEDFVNEHSN